MNTKEEVSTHAVRFYVSFSVEIEAKTEEEALKKAEEMSLFSIIEKEPYDVSMDMEIDEEEAQEGDD